MPFTKFTFCKRARNVILLHIFPNLLLLTLHFMTTILKEVHFRFVHFLSRWKIYDLG
jgi:hypothetical protein